MGSIDDIMQLCRLCLVKDQVNIPIFDETSDIRQTFLKINQCLPVKVSRDDNLPKKICDDCSYKLDMLYVFRNTSVDSEKQLMSWLSQAGLDSCSLSQSVKDGVTKPEIMVKQETFEASDVRLESENPELNADAHQELGVDAHSYIMQQQKLPYQQDFAAAFGEPSGSNEEPPPKRAKRAAATKKQVPLETEVEEALDTAMQITKAEEEDSDDVDQPDYVEAPSTSADDQPGPSGVGKIDAPYKEDPSKTKFICTQCNKEFKTKRHLYKHQRVHKEKTIPCDLCDKLFSFHYQLSNHMLNKHTGVGDGSFTCTFCEKGFKTKNGLMCHIPVHTKNYPFMCDLCNFGCVNKVKMNIHKQVVHEGKRFACELCGKEFRDPQYLKNHMLTHDEDRPKETHICPICSKIFADRKLLDRHLNRHTGKYNTVCEVCGKTIRKVSLTVHMRSHTGERPFVCKVCNKGFVKKEALVEHYRVHSKERPYKCSVCGKGFTQRGPRNIHMRQHTGEKPYRCHICAKAFITGTLLRNHTCKL